MQHVIGRVRATLFIGVAMFTLPSTAARADDDAASRPVDAASAEVDAPGADAAPAEEGARPTATGTAGAAAATDLNADDSTDKTEATRALTSDEDAWIRRGVAGAVVAVPTLVASMVAAFVFPLGLGNWIFPIIAVALPATTAGVASLFVVPWYWSWAPALAALGGTLLGGSAGILVGLAAVSQIPEDAFGGISPNLVVLLPVIGIGIGLGAAAAAGGTAMVFGGPVEGE